MEPGGGPAVFQRESGHVCAHPAEGVQRVAAALAHARTHGPHASALHDPECVHQHAAAAARHADGAAARRGLPVPGHPRGQRVGDAAHDSLLHPRVGPSGRRGDANAGAHRGRTAHLHAGRKRGGGCQGCASEGIVAQNKF